MKLVVASKIVTNSSGLLLGAIFSLVVSDGAFAEEAEQTAPPLPLHSVEGTGGHFATHSAYLVNPARPGEIFGLPSIGGKHVHLGNGRHLEDLTITQTLWDRVELGYGWNHFDMGDLPQDIERATTIRIRDHSVDLHHFNVRLSLWKDGDFDQSWLPALTVGAHYKYNDTIKDIDTDLMGTLTAIGIRDNDGFDFTLSASKMITALPRPVILSATLRSTEAAHIGLLGFTDDRELVVEGAVCVLATDRILLAAEYRQKPDKYEAIPGLVGGEDDWWTLCAGYIVNDHLTIAGGYAHFGEVLNHDANSSWGVAVKYEF
jgi:hypothetical protein